MATGGSLQPRPTKNERREAAREKARMLRDEQAKREKTRRILWQGGAILGVLILAGGLFWGFQSWEEAEAKASVGPENMISDGFLIAPGGEPVATGAIPAGGEPVPTTPDETGSVANIVSYVDFACGHCGNFEAAHGERINTLVNEGAASLEIHPISILQSSFSADAGNAFACVANYAPQNALDYFNALFTIQPQPGEPSPDSKVLVELATATGVSSPTNVESCIESGQFRNWLTAATNRALDGPIPNSSIPNVTGTPTVLVNGELFPNTDLNAFPQFILQATSKSSKESPTPTPTP